MKKTRRIIAIIVLILLALFLMLTLYGCWAPLEATAPSAYFAARNMLGCRCGYIKSIPSSEVYYKFPSVSKSHVQSMYFFNHMELLDDNVICYLNCVYSEKEYQKEYARVLDYVADNEILDCISERMQFSSGLSTKGYFSWHIEEDGKFCGTYADYFLFQPEEHRIIYVYISTKDTDWWERSYHIPDEYLPIDFLSLRESQIN